MGGTWSSWSNEEETNLRTQIRNTNRKINILVLGRPGAGKSTLVTSLRSCLTHSHGRELSAAGQLSTGASFTFRLRRYDAFDGCNVGGSVATIYDMPGLPNQSDDRIVVILRSIMTGKVPPNDEVLVSGGMTPEDIENRFQTADPTMKIDRIIFVHSCTEPISDNLTNSVFRLCCELDVVAFAVLTHIDQKNNKVESMDSLDLAVGTKGSPRGCQLQLYHRGRQSHGRYKDDPETNYYLYLLWQGLLNTDYPINSTS